MKVVIIGSGGLAREVYTWFEDVITICGFSTKNTDEFYKYNLPGKLLSSDMTTDNAGTSYAILAIGSPILKRELYHFYAQRGFCFPTFVHQTSVVAKNAVLSDGCIVSPRVIIGPNTILNKNTYVNFGTTIGHDVKIGEFCQINPASCINGSVLIGNRCTIGANTTILQRVSIADEVITAAGSTIFSHVRKSCTMIGNPAKIMCTISSL